MIGNNNTSLNSSYDDRSNRDPLTTFSFKFNTTTNFNSDLDCISLWGPVSNLNCPNDIPDCNCPPAISNLRPSFEEPTIQQLDSARNKTEECYLIKEKFGGQNGFEETEYVKWGGIDYSNKDSSYNCLGSDTYGKFAWKDSNNFSVTNSPLQEIAQLNLMEGYGTAVNSTYFPYAIRKLGSTAGAGMAWDIKDTNSILDTSSGTDGIDDKVFDNTTKIGINFPYYLEYSKTNATFWNTPKETPLYRRAQVALLKYQRIKILVNGDFTIKPGNFVYLQKPVDNQNAIVLDSRFKGQWMVYRVERVINFGKHSMYLYLMRDYPYIDTNIVNDVFVDVKNTE